jgi:hypothetical protein
VHQNPEQDQRQIRLAGLVFLITTRRPRVYYLILWLQNFQFPIYNLQ